MGVSAKLKGQLLAGMALAGGSVLIGTGNASADTHVTVNQGETVAQLAREYDSTPDAVRQANNLQSDTVELQAGQQLDIPNQRPDEWVGTDRSTVSVMADANGDVTNNMAVDTKVYDANGNVVDPNTYQGTMYDANGNVIANPADVSNNVDPNTGSNGSYVDNGNYVTSSSADYATPTTYANASLYNGNGGSYAGNVSGGSSTQYSSSEAVNRARSQLGVPYVWGGETPGSGFDCSGLAQWAEGLPSGYRTTYQQQTLGSHHYDIQNAQAGDLYFWGSDSAPYHVAVAEGGGNYIQAPQPGQNVQEQNINNFTPSYYVSMQK